MKSINPEVIRAITPLYLASIGGVIGISVMFSPTINEAKWASALGLAGTAIAGAAGLAQTSKSQSSVSVQENGEKIIAEGNSTKQSLS